MARLGEEGSYFKELPSLLLKKRDTMIQVLKEAGLTPIVPDGGYFLLADTANLGKFDIIQQYFIIKQQYLYL